MTASSTLIPVDTAVLIRLLKLREHPAESFNDVLRRVLPAQRKPTPEKKPPTPAVPSHLAAQTRSSRAVDYVMLGERRSAANGNDALLDVLRLLAARTPGFLEHLASEVRGRSRNHIARSRAEVYPERPDLSHYVVPLVDGWFVGTNIADREKMQIIEKACSVAGLVLGRDVQINLDSD